MLLHAVVLLYRIHLAGVEPSAAAAVHGMLAIHQHSGPDSHRWYTVRCTWAMRLLLHCMVQSGLHGFVQHSYCAHAD